MRSNVSKMRKVFQSELKSLEMVKVEELAIRVESIR